MPLTPIDVVNKEFRIAVRGYHRDEVDAFLDEVENELTRLLRDNAELKNGPGAASPAAGTERPAAPSLTGPGGQEAALRTLLLAQRTADEAIAEARAEAEQIVTGARAEAETTVGDARSEAESTLGAARSEATSTLDSAKEKAARVDGEVAARIQAAIGDLDSRRHTLETRIEELRAFEREYRTRLKAYLETQLRDLDSRQGPDDSGAGVPAGARAVAVGHPRGVRPDGSSPEAPAEGSPAGPPREAEGSSLRAVPPLAATGPEPVGPFTVVPSAGPDGQDAQPGQDGQDGQAGQDAGPADR